MNPLLIALIVAAIVVVIYLVATKLPPTSLTSGGSYSVSNGCLSNGQNTDNIAFATATQVYQRVPPTTAPPVYTITIKKAIVAGSSASGFQGEVLQGQITSGTGSAKLYLTWGTGGSVSMLPSQSSLFSSAASQQVVFVKTDTNPLGEYFIMPTTSYTAGMSIPAYYGAGGPPIMYLSNAISLGTSADPSFCYNWSFTPVTAS